MWRSSLLNSECHGCVSRAIASTDPASVERRLFGYQANHKPHKLSTDPASVEATTGELVSRRPTDPGSVETARAAGCRVSHRSSLHRCRVGEGDDFTPAIRSGQKTDSTATTFGIEKVNYASISVTT